MAGGAAAAAAGARLNAAGAAPAGQGCAWRPGRPRPPFSLTLRCRSRPPFLGGRGSGILQAAFAHLFPGAIAIAITVEAVYEQGVLKPVGALPLREHQHVRIAVEEPLDWVYRTRGIIPCSDHALMEWAAMDPDLEYDFGREP